MPDRQTTSSRKSLFFLLLITLLCVALVGVLMQWSPSTLSNRLEPAEPAKPVIPYIWWYADTHNAFVMERADGTDSRFIAEGLNPKDNIVFQDSSFSASGEWFAWLSDEASRGGHPTYRGHAVRVQDGERLHLLEDIRHLVFLRWSPVNDRLFVGYWEDTFLNLMIVDANTADVLVSARLHRYLTVYHSDRTPVRWSDDGSAAYYTSGQHHVMLDTRGQTAIYERATDSEFYAWDGEYIIREALHRTPDGLYDYNTREIILENIRTGQRIVLDDSPALEYSILPGSDRTRLLIESGQRGDRDLRLVEPATGTITSLPDNMALQRCRSNVCPPMPVWSPDGRYVLLHQQDNTWHLLNAQTGTIDNISTPDDEFAVHQWHWLLQQSQILFMQDEPAELYRYSIETNTNPWEQIDVFQYPPALFPSPDGRYIGHSDFIGLLDTETNESIEWVKHSAGMAGASTLIMNIEWHSDSQWFITVDDTMYAGGGGAATARTIHSVDGIRRELGDCYGACSGFMPPRVLAHLPAGSEQSVVPEPVTTILHDGTVTGVTWKPDGTQLLSYEHVSHTDESDVYFINQWDVSRETPQRIARHPVDFDCNTHPFPCVLIWQDENSVLLSDYGSGITLNLDSGVTTEVDYDDIRERIQPLPQRVTDLDELTAFNDMQGTDFGYNDNTIYFHEANQTHELASNHRIVNIRAYDYHSDSGLLVAGSFFTRVQVWDVETGEHLTPINRNARDMALSPDGTRLAAAGTRYITLWDMTGYAR